MSNQSTVQDAAISTSLLAPAVAGMHALGIDTQNLLRRVGIPDLNEPSPIEFVPYGKVARLWQHLVDETNDPAIGLRVAEALQADQFDLIAFLGRASGTLMDIFSTAPGAARV